MLGASHMPELIEDDQMFKNNLTLKKFILSANSSLKTALCNKDVNGKCQWRNTVTLDGNIACTGKECDADTLRVIQVSDGIHYEYVRPACVEQAFYADAKKIIYKERWSASSCANPLLPYASEACCAGTFDLQAERSPSYLYDQERVTYSTADVRCKAMGMFSCDFNEITGIDNNKKGFHWTTDSCAIQVKVNAIGQVAMVYKPDVSLKCEPLILHIFERMCLMVIALLQSYATLHPHVRDDNRNFFKVYWDSEYPMNNNDVTMGNSCGNNACETLELGGCLCTIGPITESVVFNKMPKSVNDVLSKLTVGAYDTAAYPEGTYTPPTTSNGVTAYLVASSGVFDTNTVFEVTDDTGRLHRLKNTRSIVNIQGASTYAFRNAPSFMSVLNTEVSLSSYMDGRHISTKYCDLLIV